MTTPTRYRTFHASGRVGETFDFATQAALWILSQHDYKAWRWEAVR